jgi:dolichol-phosphate mannosyltransferase
LLSTSGRVEDPLVTKFSIIIPADLSNPLILDLLSSIIRNIQEDYAVEILLLEILDNSQRLTEAGREMKSSVVMRILELNERQKTNNRFFIKLVRNDKAKQKIRVLLDGIKSAKGENVVIMNDDFTHPPDILPRMMELLVEHRMVVGSRYINGGSVSGRTMIRKLIGKGGAAIARYGLRVRNVKDPISGFIAFPRKIIESISIDHTAYSLSLEILVKSKGLDILEIPYCFKENSTSHQKLIPSIITCARSILHLYMDGPKSAESSKDIKYRRSVKFLSKAGRFYTVGASGLLVNYFVSTAISSGALSHLWYLQATLVGILVSIFTNFFLNKIWTFQDRNFSLAHTFKQFIFFLLISSFGAVLQLGFVYLLVQNGFEYAISLLLAVVFASAGNFLLNKKLTFKDRLWG